MRVWVKSITGAAAAMALALVSTSAVAQIQPADPAATPPPSDTPVDTSPNPFNRDALINIAILGALSAVVLVATTTGHDKKNKTSPASP